MQPAVHVCGDIHLRPDDRGAFAAFLDRLQGLAPGRLVILGDCFEYWLDTARHVRKYAWFFARIDDLVAAGWRVDLVVGNRELTFGRRLVTAARWRVHWPRLDLAFPLGVVRVVHGDRLVRDPAYRGFSALIRSWWFQGWRNAVPDPLQNIIARWFRGRSMARQRRVAEQGAPPSMLDPRRVRAAIPGARRILAGHIHEQWRRRIGGVDLTLCGHWDPDVGRWVELDAAGNLRLRCQPLP